MPFKKPPTTQILSYVALVVAAGRCCWSSPLVVAAGRCRWSLPLVVAAGRCVALCIALHRGQEAFSRRCSGRHEASIRELHQLQLSSHAAPCLALCGALCTWPVLCSFGYHYLSDRSFVNLGITIYLPFSDFRPIALGNGVGTVGAGAGGAGAGGGAEEKTRTCC